MELKTNLKKLLLFAVLPLLSTAFSYCNLNISLAGDIFDARWREQMAITGGGGGGQTAPPLLFENFDTNPLWPHQGWVDSGGTYTVKAVSNATAVSAPNSFQMVNTILGVHSSGITYNFGGAKPSYIGFFINCSGGGAAEGYTTIRDSLNQYVFFAYCANLVYTNTSAGAGGVSITTPAFAINTWHSIELKNMDWALQKYDFYVDGALVTTGADFRTVSSGQIASGLYRFELYNYQPGGSSFDDIMIR